MGWGRGCERKRKMTSLVSQRRHPSCSCLLVAALPFKRVVLLLISFSEKQMEGTLTSLVSESRGLQIRLQAPVQQYRYASPSLQHVSVRLNDNVRNPDRTFSQ
jgi:hypothetical protein